ncbi:MAG: efflux RND transporter periplasmic adaptor subunit [Chthonomonadaceae bacterium]|nr:efflux RND transporter periplasmic adaptor subunit [Chthonomonadaceae bacterium]
MIKKIIAPVLIVGALVAGGFFVAKTLRPDPSKTQNQYRIAKVSTGLVKKTVTATGVVKPWKVVDIRSRAGGRVTTYGPDLELAKEEPGKPQRRIEEGSIVRKGAVLCSIDPSDTLLTYNNAKADIESNVARVDETRRNLALQEQQVLVQIMTARANRDSAKSAVLAAKARYEQAKTQADNQGELTSANIENVAATLSAEKERLNQIQTATQRQQMATAQANLRQAAANLKNAELTLNRQKELLAKGFIAEASVDATQANYDVASATYQNVKERMDTIKPEQEADLKSQQARVRQIEAQLRTAQANKVDVSLKKEVANAAYADYQRSLSDVKTAEANYQQAQANKINNSIRASQIKQAQASGSRAQASLVNAQIQLDETKVSAPSDGIVLKKYIEEGTLISSGISFNSTGTNIVQLGNIDRMYVDVQVDETDVANVVMDQKVDITCDAYPTTPVEGKVIKVQPQAVIEQNVTTIHVWVEIDNSAATFKLIKPGMNASCEFIVDRKEDVVSVPNEALHTDLDGTHYVDIASGGTPAPAEKGSEPDPALLVGVKTEKRKVETELEGNDATEVKSGLKADETIITQVIEPSAAASSGGGPFGGGGKGPGKK